MNKQEGYLVKLIPIFKLKKSRIFTKAKGVSFRGNAILKNVILMTTEIFVGFEFYGNRLREYLWRSLRSEKEIYFC